MTRATRSAVRPLSLLLACSAAACGAGEASDPVAASQAPLSLTGTFIINNSINANTTAQREHCRVPTDNNGNLRFTAGRQLLIRRNGAVTGLCTVDAVAAAGSSFEMHSTAYGNRLGANPAGITFTVSDEWQAGAAPAVARPATTVDSALLDSTDQPREYAHRASTAQVVYTAPHPFEGGLQGGSNGLTLGTFGEARAIHNADPARNAIWVAGYEGGSISLDTFNRSHITATEINPESFPLLGGFLTQRMPYAVSFHGHGSGCTEDVAVGGNIEAPFRDGVAEIIERYLLAAGKLRAFPNVVTSSASNCFFGHEPDNFVNDIAFGDRGLQLEQSKPLRDDAVALDAVRDGVRSVFDCLLDAPDHDANLAYDDYWHSAVAPDTAYAAGKCPRWIARVNMTNDYPDKAFSAGAYGTCQHGTTAHNDFYRQRTDGTWERIGGGWIDYRNTTQPDGTVVCKGFERGGYITPAVTTPAVFRAVVGAWDATGAPLRAFFHISG